MKRKFKVKTIQTSYFSEIRGYEPGYGGFNTGHYERDVETTYKVGNKTFKTKYQAYKYKKEIEGRSTKTY